MIVKPCCFTLITLWFKQQWEQIQFTNRTFCCYSVWCRHTSLIGTTNRKQFNVVQREQLHMFQSKMQTSALELKLCSEWKLNLIQKMAKKKKKVNFSSDLGGIMWWLTGHFDLSCDAAGTFSEQWLPRVPASPVPQGRFSYATGCNVPPMHFLMNQLQDSSDSLGSLYILPVCPQRFAPSYSCQGRAALLPHRYLFHWVCRWFENHQRRLYADPTVRAVQYRLCEKDIVETKKELRTQLSVSPVPGSWWWCCPLGLCTQSCPPSPLGRFCLLQQTSASQRTCRRS